MESVFEKTERELGGNETPVQESRDKEKRKQKKWKRGKKKTQNKQQIIREVQPRVVIWK